jgi:hypothetical protein
MTLRCAATLPRREFGGYAELSVSIAMTELTSWVQFQFNNIGPFIIMPPISVHLSSCPTEQLCIYLLQKPITVTNNILSISVLQMLLQI